MLTPLQSTAVQRNCSAIHPPLIMHLTSRLMYFSIQVTVMLLTRAVLNSAHLMLKRDESECKVMLVVMYS